jgi:putative tricarboxylic transport membrane protein
MIEYFIVGLVGTFCGLITGLLPGLGAATLLLTLSPILYQFDLNHLIIFYITMISATQYYGSITAIVFSVVGEVTSGPAVRNGHPIYQKGMGPQLLAATATGSFIASIIAIALLLISANFAEMIIAFLKLEIRIAIYSTVLLILTLFTKNKLLSFILMIAGLILGTAGFDPITLKHLFVVEYSIFDGGIPFAPLLMGFIVIPLLIEYILKKTNLSTVNNTALDLKTRFLHLVKFTHIKSCLRGSLIGCVSGLIPGVSYAVSANMAESVEKKCQNHSDSDINKIRYTIAAESANNAGSITVLIPLLLFGLAIVPSEAIILSIAERKGFYGIEGFSYVLENFSLLLVIMILFNLINWVLAGYWYSVISTIYARLSKFVYQIILLICIFIVAYVGYADNQTMLALITFFSSVLVGLIIKNTESKLVMVFAFFIASNIYSDIARLYIKLF